MAKITHREKILLGYNPSSLSNSSSRRDSEVDFSDVFGGPPRCSSSTQEFQTNEIDDDDNNIDSFEDVDKDEGIWFGFMEKPVFGDQIGVRKPYPSDDFYDDIFGGDQPLMSCSLPPKVHMPGRSPFLSTPGSRGMSPSRPSSVVEPSASPSKFSLPGRAINTDIMNSTSMNQNLKFFSRSLPRCNHTIPNHSTLNGDDALTSHKPSSLSRQISADENKLTSDSIVEGTADQHEAEFIMEDSKGSKFANENMQFHFSIYKWANKGIPIVLSSRKRCPSRSKQRVTSDAMLVMEDNKGGVNVNDAVSSSKRRMSSTPQIRGPEHSNDIVVGGVSVECKLEDDKVENPTYEAGEARRQGLVGVKEVLVHSETGLDAKSIKHSAKMRKSNTKPLRALFGEEKEGNKKATAEKGRKQSIVNETQKPSLKNDVFPKVNRKSKVHESSTTEKDGLRKDEVAGKVKDYVRILNQDFSSQVKSNVMGQNPNSKWKDTTRFEVGNEFNTFPTKNHDEMQDSCANLLKTWPESIEVVDGEAFLSVEQECTINGGASVSGSASNDEPNIEGMRAPAPKTSATSVDDNLGMGVVQNVDLQLATEFQEETQLYERKVRHWSKGKEGNIRALLSTMQNVLWPNSGWKPVPLVDIIEANAVKRAYQRALLCLHPDKLQQKGAAPYQKLIAEKIFDILQEAWDEFNSLGML